MNKQVNLPGKYPKHIPSDYNNQTEHLFVRVLCWDNFDFFFERVLFVCFDDLGNVGGLENEIIQTHVSVLRVRS